MKIVIDIPDEEYACIQSGKVNLLLGGRCGGKMMTINLYKRVRNGKVLPKGHGRLIDADAYIAKHEECGWLDDITVDEFNTMTPTIIEADKEGSEEE